MKSLKWIVPILIILGLLGFFWWRQEKKPGGPSSRDHKNSTEQTNSNSQNLSDIASTSAGSFSAAPHEPTPLEIAIIIRTVPPSRTQQLLNAYKQNPSFFDHNEAAALIVATLLLDIGRQEEYERLAKSWSSHTSYPASWFVLNGDYLLSQGSKEKAVEWLNSKSFQGPEDTARLGRLALLESNHADKALAYLHTAQSQDPDNPLIPILMARLLEKENKITEASQVLSKGVKGQGPKQPQQIEALADLFNRYGYNAYAVAVWDSAADRLSDDTIAEALFWKRVLGTHEGTAQLPENTPYLHYLAALPKGRFWDDKEFNRLPGHEEILASHQETFWLRLLQDLADGNKEAALQLLQENRFQDASWNPQLEEALQAALNDQLNGSLSLASSKKPRENALEKEYGTGAWRLQGDAPFIQALLEGARSNKELDASSTALLRSPDVYSAILMANGWQKAALDLYKSGNQQLQYPEWYISDLLKTLSNERGTEEALAFASKQKGSSTLSLEIAELFIRKGEVEKGIKMLEPIRAENDEIGARAAWISAQYYWRKGNLDVARQIIQSNHFLSETPMGQEALAIISAKKAKHHPESSN